MSIFLRPRALGREGAASRRSAMASDYISKLVDSR